jgi:hypothetical protein
MIRSHHLIRGVGWSNGAEVRRLKTAMRWKIPAAQRQRSDGRQLSRHRHRRAAERRRVPPTRGTLPICGSTSVIWAEDRGEARRSAHPRERRFLEKFILQFVGYPHCCSSLSSPISFRREPSNNPPPSMRGGRGDRHAPGRHRDDPGLRCRTGAGRVAGPRVGSGAAPA